MRDYRFDVRSRRYPRRDVPGERLLEVADALGRPPASRDALARLLSDSEGVVTTLSGFQLRAGEAILAAQDAVEAVRTGTVITAGTGSGKTLAFYAPALAEIAALISKDARPSLKAIAIYPRNELLKDQLGEVLRLTRRLSRVGRTRSIRIGAYYGDVPLWLDAQHEPARWARVGPGWRCPYVRCPLCGNETLLWQKNRSGLTCHRAGCDGQIGAHELALSRQDIQVAPVDLLFTSTEMLNRSLSQSWSWPAFGVGDAPGPRLLLLDEIHTYTSLHGASVAMLLRRYQRSARGALHITGLSATLRDARAFFSDLTGIDPSRVSLVEPHPDEMIEEGAEYQLALRSDPTSGASVLSTSIQSLMLLRRALDPWSDPPSGGIYGRRVFAFTDTLDVVNRFLPDLQDAEGRTPWGEPSQRHPKGSLANIRARATAEAAGDIAARERDGQVWGMAEDLGHRLEGAEVRIARTTSQDTGVDERADIVLATAALDVGYDDPEVGAVLQHKAPRAVSQFLQRRGRAGRPRRMRPWTVLVLSDFGRDRLAYHSYEQMFDPVLEAQPLPIGNRHVLKMHATYALLDFLERTVSRIRRGSSWQELGGDGRGERISPIVAVLEEVLAGGPARARLGRHIRGALRLSERELEAVLWSPPRALLATVIPTALRRLETGWRSLEPGSGGREAIDRTHPLPEFVPRALFESLNNPDVRIDAPGREPEALSIDQALNEFSPGNVSRRFAVRGQQKSHWVPLEPSLPEQRLELTDWCQEFDELGVFGESLGDAVRCVRPRLLRLQEVPPEVSDSSAARPLWQSELRADGEPMRLDLDVAPAWRRLLSEIAFYTHSVGAAVEARRYATRSRASVLSGTQRREVSADFDLEGEPVGVGYAIDADAIRLEIVVPGDLTPSPEARGGYATAFRRAWFVHRVTSEPRLAQATGRLGQERLADLYLTALAAEALACESALDKARGAIAANLADRLLSAAAETTWREIDPDHDDDAAALTDPAENGNGAQPAGLRRLSALLEAHPNIPAILDELAQELSGPLSSGAQAWARTRFLLTVAAAVRDAAQRLCPEVDLYDTSLDLEPETDESLGRVWITELAVGGSGAIESVRLRSAERPRRLLSLIRASLSASDLEAADEQLTETLRGVRKGAVAEVLGAARTALVGHESLSVVRDRVEAFFSDLESRGTALSPTGRVAISARLLRAGASPELDQVLLELAERWTALTERLGVNVSLPAMSYALSADPAIDRALIGLAGAPPPLGREQAWRVGVLTMLLWPRGGTLRAGALSAGGRFLDAPPTDRLGVIDRLPPAPPEVLVENPEWRAELTGALSEHGEASLATRAGARALREALLDLMAEPIESGYLHLYPRLDGTSIAGSALSAELSLRELDA